MANSAPPPPPATPSPASKLVRIIAVVILALIVLVGLAVLITWLAVKPKQLVFRIDNASARDFSLKNDHLNATFAFLIKAHNPNGRISVYYGPAEVSAAYDGQTVAFNTLAPFRQPRRNVTWLAATLVARDVALPRDVSTDLAVQKKSGNIGLVVRMKARIRFKVGIFRLKHHTLRVSCSPVKVRMPLFKNFETTTCDLDW
ncbi:hypothetical protein OIU85_014262 [Salix viminalis]|uniref:Late embryogenesis abundant protein LEA-2 subgroup domain-containing protein n=3 Tax=Salix TaxID=40685 RepID=A0A9Q0NI81_SALVM|nr:hypothetical protein OIU84_008394 [Salix udensis]KAJ6670356.1 hypothetical protein OIU85_014262 [Salix viminalis]